MNHLQTNSLLNDFFPAGRVTLRKGLQPTRLCKIKKDSC